MERNFVEINLPALYNGRGIEAADNAAKDLLFNNQETYFIYDQRVYTRTYTLYGVDESRKNVRKEFATILEVVYDENDAPFFKFSVPESLSKLVDQIPEPVIVCTARCEKQEDGTYIARKPKYILYNYADYMEEEKRKLESKVFRKGSVFPKNNNKGLSSTIQERVETPVVEEHAEAQEAEATQYAPVETKSPEQDLAKRMAEERAKLMSQMPIPQAPAGMYDNRKLQPSVSFCL